VNSARALPSLILASLLLVGATACSSSSATTDPATSTTAPSAAATGGATAAPAGASYSPQPWSLPTPSSSADAKAIWCSALVQVIKQTVPGLQTDGELHNRIDALATYKEMWVTAEQQGYVTHQEAEVNRSYLDGTIELVQLKLARKSDSSPETAKVIEGMNTLTADSKSLFDSSAAKITEFCQLTYGSAAPTASASPASS
jgi:hypothetical protein